VNPRGEGASFSVLSYRYGQVTLKEGFLPEHCPTRPRGNELPVPPADMMTFITKNTFCRAETSSYNRPKIQLLGPQSLK